MGRAPYQHVRHWDRIVRVVLLIAIAVEEVPRAVLHSGAEVVPACDVFVDTVQAEHITFDPDVIIE